MNEHGYIKAVHRQISNSVFRWKINDTYAGGVPDAFYAGPACCLFVEYKYVTLPKKETSLVRTSLSEQQKLWLNRMLAIDKHVAVVIGSPIGGLILLNGLWNSPLTKTQFTKYALTKKEIANWIECVCLSKNYDHEEEGFFSGC